MCIDDNSDLLNNNVGNVFFINIVFDDGSGYGSYFVMNVIDGNIDFVLWWVGSGFFVNLMV